ncbi:hypothetical protein DsansV1_C05g0057871 [Dioscorea sansibarensis]
MPELAGQWILLELAGNLSGKGEINSDNIMVTTGQVLGAPLSQQVIGPPSGPKLSQFALEFSPIEHILFVIFFTPSSLFFIHGAFCYTESHSTITWFTFYNQTRPKEYSLHFTKDTKNSRSPASGHSSGCTSGRVGDSLAVLPKSAEKQHLQIT